MTESERIAAIVERAVASGHIVAGNGWALIDPRVWAAIATTGAGWTGHRAVKAGFKAADSPSEATSVIVNIRPPA